MEETATKNAFYPINGIEAKEAILQSISKKLDVHPDLTIGISFPRLTFRWELTLQAYPKNPSEMKTKLETTVGDKEFSGEPLKMKMSDEVRIGIEVSPETVREQLDKDRADGISEPLNEKEVRGLRRFLRKK